MPNCTNNATPVAAPIGAEALPPLPEADEYSATRMLANGELAPRFFGATVRNFALSAIAPHVERIRVLERELELSKKKLGLALKCDREKAERLQDLAQERAAPAWAAFADNGNVIIWSRNRSEVDAVAVKYGRPVEPSLAHIDGRTAGTVPEGWQLVPVEPTMAMIAALGWEGDEMLAIGHGLISQGIANQYKAALAAAPSSLSGTEVAK